MGRIDGCTARDKLHMQMLRHAGKLLFKQRDRQFQNLGAVGVRIKPPPECGLCLIIQLLILYVESKIRL